MKLVIQRVTEAQVSTGGETLSRIGAGMMVLVGIHADDTEADVEAMARKTAALRIFDDADGVMNLSVTQTGGEILAVSQFTLLAQTRRGNRPSYIEAARPEKAEPLYELYCRRLGELTGQSVGRGRFGADMKVSLVNDGPVTIIMDTRAQ